MSKSMAAAISLTEDRRNLELGSVRKLKANELRRFAEVLALAFNDDPPTRWILPDDNRRQALLAKGLHLWARKLWFPLGECLTTENVLGAAAWIPPGGWEISPLRQLLLLPSMALVFGRSTTRVVSAILALEANHPKEAHFYLPFAGVIPEWQGKGLGTALLAPVLERCDSEGIPAYLEASSPTNRRLYERHGFVVTEEFSFGDDAPPLWRMWRAPN
ncbi:GNAT family N-acetyltransferase [Zhongshania arctica]|uniref:GNAT family N-acetyltransferase n=1 Tax=Zhongshania arctica TaxID=3238302 RepID=A0ABV3TTH0_9GAMM